MNRRQAAIKRGFDLGLAIPAFLLASPIIFTVFVLASMDTRTNGFFVQKRVGKSGRLFPVLKIRTMRRETHGGSPVVTASSARITALGGVWRKTNIDELPQLVNIILGHMSFVGPRPDVPGYADQLRGEDREVLGVRPGITGPASLKYRDEEEILDSQPDPQAYNDEVIWPDKVRINLEYVRNWSLVKDIGYIVRTIFDTGRDI